MESKLAQIRQYAAMKMAGFTFDHNIDHVMRVYNTALQIAESEGEVNLEILKISVLLHDIGYDQECTDKIDHAVRGAEMAREYLSVMGFASNKIEQIFHCIISHRYRSDYVPETIEAKILYDADKLDGTGAIEIVRGSIWLSKFKANPFASYPGERYIEENMGGKIDGRIKDKSKHSLFIDFELKGKYLPERMYTETGGKFAKEGVVFYQTFLTRLKKEISGER